jgi:hypothetical protein
MSISIFVTRTIIDFTVSSENEWQYVTGERTVETEVRLPRHDPPILEDNVNRKRIVLRGTTRHSNYSNEAPRST